MGIAERENEKKNRNRETETETGTITFQRRESEALVKSMVRIEREVIDCHTWDGGSTLSMGMTI